MNTFIKRVRAEFARDLSTMMLRIGIIVLALVLAIAAITIQSKWVLAGILAWILLP
jgi:hypothetical protein